MQSIINLKWFSKVVIVLLIFSLLIPSVSYAADADDRGGGGEAEGESEAEKAAREEAEREAAEAEQAAQDAADVNTAASISGAAAAGISASAVNTAGPATPGNVNVSVNGAPAVSMSKEQAMAAVGAVAGATKSGTVSAKSVGVSTEATVGAYAKGELKGGQVVGATTGVRGSPEAVADYEGHHSISGSSVSKANSLSNAPTALSDTAFDARFNGVPTANAIDPTTVTTAPNLRDALAQAAVTAAAAAKAINNELGVGSAIAAPTAPTNPVQDKIDALGSAVATEDVSINVNLKGLPETQKQAVRTAFDNFNERTLNEVDATVNNSTLASDLSRALGDEAASRVNVGVAGKTTEVSVGRPSSPSPEKNTPAPAGSTANTANTPNNPNAPNYSRSLPGTASPAAPAPASPDFSFSGKATDAKPASTPSTGGGTPTGATEKAARAAAQVEARDNTVEREGGSGVTADRNVFTQRNNVTGGNFDMPGQPEINADDGTVTTVPTVNVNNLSNAQAEVIGVVNNDLTPADVERGAQALAGELYGPATTRIAQGKATQQDIIAAKTQIFAYANRAAANGKSFEANVEEASVVFYTEDKSPKSYAVANYNQNPTAFKQMVKDIMKGTYGIDVPCPSCVDFGAAGPDIFDPHVDIPSGTFTAAGRPQHTSPEVVEAILGNQLNKFQSLLTFQNRGIGNAPSVDVASITNPPGIGGTGDGTGAGTGSETDGTATAALPGGDDNGNGDGSDSGDNTGDGEGDGNSGETPSNSKAGQVVEGHRGSTRSADIDGTLKDQLAYAGKMTGTYFVVSSGGNEMSMAEYKAAKGKKSKIGNKYYLNGKAVRVGSTRHDHGDAADGQIVDAATGRTLDFSNTADKDRIADFITAAVKAGATGVGAAAEYMGTDTVHIGGGRTLAWGKAGKAKHAPGWVKSAHAAGLEQAENFDLAEYNASQGDTTDLAAAGIDNENTATLPASPAAEAALDKVEAAKDKIAEHSHDHETDQNTPDADGPTTDDTEPSDSPTDGETTDTGSDSNEDTAATASVGIETLEERINEIEDQLNTKDLTDEQIADLSAEIDAATEAIDSFNKAIEEAEAGNTEAGSEALAEAEDKFAGVNQMSESNKAKTADAPDRATAAPEDTTDETVDESLETEPTFQNPIPEPVMEVITNPVVRAVVTAAIFGTNPVIGIAVAVGIDKIKDLPVVDKILNDILKYDSDAVLSPRDLEGGGNQQATSTRAIYTIPVIVTTDIRTGKIDLTVTEILYDHESIADSEEGEEIYSPGRSEDGFLPLVLNEFGEIVYSDGTYAPRYIDGVEYPDPETEYIYISQTVDGSQALPAADDTSMLPENFATNFIRGLFGNNSPFTIEDVYRAVRYYVDPDTEVPGDEYYDYVFTLKDRTLRTVAIPVYTSFATMQARLTSVGYEGNILLLLNQVSDAVREAKPNLAERAFDMIMDTANSIWPEETVPLVTDLTNGNSSTDNIFDIRDIKEATVYVGVEANCPNVPSLNRGYIYEVVVYQSSIPNAPADGIIQEVRCGTGDPLIYASEITRHLERIHGFARLDVNEFMGLTTFNFYNPGIDNAAIDINDIIIPEKDIPDPSVTIVPNTTNAIGFEARATDKITGELLANWSTNNLVIDRNTDLYFRWDGGAYTQCLPFLNDNGDYALSLADSDAMTNGNTEEENYDVIEASYSYRVECGGQKNNEFGVDSKTIQVTIE